jgi:hypothetical protein
MPEDDKRTVFARKAIDLADLFAKWAGEYPVGGLNAYEVKMTTPDGPSTGGGKQGTQHITLQPSRGGPPLVAGTVNQLMRVVELRTWAYMREQQERRNPGMQFGLDVKAYRLFFDRMVEFFEGAQFKVSTVDVTSLEATASPPPRGTPKQSFPWKWILGAAVVLLALAIGIAIGRTRLP